MSDKHTKTLDDAIEARTMAKEAYDGALEISTRASEVSIPDINAEALRLRGEF